MNKCKQLFLDFVDENEDGLSKKDFEIILADMEKQNASLKVLLNDYKKITLDLKKEYAVMERVQKETNASIQTSLEQYKGINLCLQVRIESLKTSFDAYKRSSRQTYEIQLMIIEKLELSRTLLERENKAAAQRLRQSTLKCCGYKHRIESLEKTINELHIEPHKLLAAIDFLQSELTATKNEHNAYKVERDRKSVV